MRVLLLTSAAISGALSLIMVFFLRRHREHAGFAAWTAASALISLMFLFAGLRGIIPPTISVIGVNATILTAAPLFLDGTRRFLGLTPPARGWYALSLAAFGACLYFLFARDEIAVRTSIVMLAGAAPFAAIVLLVARHRPSRESLLARALAVQLALLSASMVLRGFWVIGRPGFSLFYESPEQYLFFGLTVVLHLGVTVTFVLMTTERVAAQLAETGMELAARVEQLERTLAEVKTLRGLLPICASCKRIRDEHDVWIQMEVYVRDRSQAEFSHGLCPDCLPKYLSLPPRA